MINALLWAPLAFGVVGLFLPKRLVGWWATAGAVATLVIAVIMAFGFDNGAARAAGHGQHDLDLRARRRTTASGSTA